jgi:hypothetical protein
LWGARGIDAPRAFLDLAGRAGGSGKTSVGGNGGDGVVVVTSW